VARFLISPFWRFLTRDAWVQVFEILFRNPEAGNRTGVKPQKFGRMQAILPKERSGAGADYPLQLG
jgi:hypothetical protein